MRDKPSIEDRELLAELASLLDRVDPVPARLYKKAYAAVAPIRTERLHSDVDTRVAELPGVRGQGTERVLRFNGDSLTVQLMVSGTEAGTLRILGVISPETHHRITARWPDGSTSATVEEHGRFLLTSIPCGPVRLEIDDLARTEWFLG